MLCARRLLAAGIAASLTTLWLLRRRKQSRTRDHATTLAAGARSQLRAQRRALQEEQRAAKAVRRSSGRQPKRPAQRLPPITAAAAASEAARSPPTSQSCPDSFGASRALTAAETRERLLSVLQATTRSSWAYSGARFPAGYHTWSLPGGPDGEPTVVRGERDASLRLGALRAAYDTRGKCALGLPAPACSFLQPCERTRLLHHVNHRLSHAANTLQHRAATPCDAVGQVRA